MFTGLIEKIGTVRAKEVRTDTCVLTIALEQMWDDVLIGESIAVNGVCLSVTTLQKDSFSVDVSLPTLRDSTIGGLRSGAPVNLERALRMGDRLGGHLVQGHVDGTARIMQIKKTAANVFLTFQADPALMQYLILKGSVAIDGVSLTIQELTDTYFTVVIIPHTFHNTTFSKLALNDPVNLEVDLISKYTQKHLLHTSKTPLTVDYLREKGF
jgi:riboflavin synthase